MLEDGLQTDPCQCHTIFRSIMALISFRKSMAFEQEYDVCASLFYENVKTNVPAFDIYNV